MFSLLSNICVVSELFKEDHFQCLSLSKPSSLILDVYVVYFFLFKCKEMTHEATVVGFFKAA